MWEPSLGGRFPWEALGVFVPAGNTNSEIHEETCISQDVASARAAEAGISLENGRKGQVFPCPSVTES